MKAGKLEKGRRKDDERASRAEAQQERNGTLGVTQAKNASSASLKSI